nr:hypothetical protein [uncultured Acidovorax sp.]
MASVVRFKTSKFNVAAEKPNPINPFAGQSLLLWLREAALPRIDVTEPEPEDWGWYSFATWDGRTYILGSSASEEQNGEHEWVLQVVKQRTLVEKVLGRERMQKDDGLASFVLQLLQQEPAFHGVSASAEP